MTFEIKVKKSQNFAVVEPVKELPVVADVDVVVVGATVPGVAIAGR